MMIMPNRIQRPPMHLLSLASTILLVCALIHPTSAVVNLPGVEFNAATGQTGHASSYYNYKPNPVRDIVFVPQNAIDGFMDESSWWSSGEEDPINDTIFWQLNMTRSPPALKRIVIRWHGFLTPATYAVRVSLVGEKFLTIASIVNASISYDRVDTITAGLDKVDTRFKFVRVEIATPNVCKDMYSCSVEGTTTALGKTNERVVYGIREFELWAVGTKNGAMNRGRGGVDRWVVVLLALSTAWLYGDVGGR